MRMQVCGVFWFWWGVKSGSGFSMFCSTLHWGDRLQGYRHISVRMRGPLYKFNSGSLRDRLVSLDIMKVKTEFEVSIFIYFQMI